ncbi:hypothetical protein HKD37_20G055777 [Glycine soja]
MGTHLLLEVASPLSLPSPFCCHLSSKKQRNPLMKKILGLQAPMELASQSYPARALDRKLQVDWAKDAREGPRVLMSLRTHLLLEVASPLSLPSPFCCHLSSKKQRNPLMKKILGLQAPMELASQSYPARALDRKLQVDWAKDAREGPRVLMSLRTHLLLEVASPLSLPSPFCCHLSSKKQRNPLMKKILGLQAPMELASQSYPARALDRKLQVDWAKDAREGPRVLMSLRTHLLLEVASPLSLPSPFCCHLSSKKQRNPLMKKILGLQAPMELASQSYPARALDRKLQVDWAKDAREGPRVLMSLRTHLLLEVASPLSLPSPFCCHLSSKKQRNPLMKKILGLQAPMELASQSYPARALDRKLQVDWAKDAREGPRVLMSLRTHLLLEVASPLSLPSPFCCHLSSKKQRNPLMKKILGLQAPMELASQSYPARALDRKLQVDWAKDAREGPRVLMSLRTHLLLEVASPLSLPSPFCCHLSSKKQRNPLMKKILGLQAPM